MLEFMSSSGSGLILALLKGAGIGLLIGIAVVLIAGKLGLFRRHSKKYNLAVKLYYLYLPIVFILFFGARSGLYAGQDRVFDLFDQLTPTVTQMSVDSAKAMLSKLSPGDAKDMSPAELAKLVYTQLDDIASKSLDTLPGWVRSVIAPVRPAVVKAISWGLKEQLYKIIAEYTGMDKQNLLGLFNTGITASLQDGLVMDVARKEVSKRFDSISGTMLKVFLALLLPVILETAIYKYRRRKALAEGAAG